MTTFINLATADGHIRSSSTSYSSANGAGSALTVEATASTWRFGQNKLGSTYEIHEGFVTFPYTLDAQSKVVTAYVDLSVEETTGPGVSRNLGMREYVWSGGGLTTADWRNPSTISSLTRYGYAGGINGASAGGHIFATEGPMNDWLDTTGSKEVVIYNDRITGAAVPTAAEYTDVWAVESASSDPALVYSTVPLHTLVRVAGCQVQLSDGRHVFIDASAGGVSPTLTLQYKAGSSAAVNIATNLLSGVRDMGHAKQALQQYALVRDASDNLYWIGRANGGGNVLNVVTWKKTGTNTWLEQTFRQADMPSALGNPVINNVSAAWHNVGNSGTIMVVVGRDCTSTDGDPAGEMSYALLNCQYLLTGVGSLLRASGDAYSAGLISPSAIPLDWNQPLNPVGTSLDVCALDSTRGVVVTLNRSSDMGDYAPISIARYILNSTGTGISLASLANQTLWATKDASAKARVLPISSTRFAVVTMDQDTSWGPTIYVIQNVGNSTTFSTLGSVTLDDEGIASLPDPSTMHDKSNWDALYHPDANTIYVYYFDAANSLRLMRTTFNLTTYVAARDEIQVQATVGAAGNTNHAIRVARGAVTISEALVSVATKTTGNVQSTVYVVDRLNVPPLAPTLVDKANYDATTGALFDWNFNDLNVGDSQTAYELQIDNADSLASVVATGKVTSTVTERNVTGGTLTNGINYRWRVRTWDTSDAVGAWSGYDFFTTSSGGSTNITNPATDNPAGYLYDDVLVQWTTTLTQASYRVRVVNNVTGVQLSDTGFVTSTSLQHQLSGLLSDVEYRIEVTTRNSALVSSNTATRLLTPNYNEPEKPSIVVSPQDTGGYIFVSVTNPAPQGDRPEVLKNQILRRRSGDPTWITIAEIPYNGSYQDWHTGSGIAYEYKVLAVAEVGIAESDTLTVTLQLMGVWMHLPSDPSGTAVNYMFGANQRGATHVSYSELTHYAGRESPVADFAHYHDQTFNVVIDIPYGEDYHDKLDALYALEHSHSVLVYRDNRRRNAFGIMNGGFTESDQATGMQISFDITRVHYKEEVV